jgi:hypothetical protein
MGERQRDKPKAAGLPDQDKAAKIKILEIRDQNKETRPRKTKQIRVVCSLELAGRKIENPGVIDTGACICAIDAKLFDKLNLPDRIRGANNLELEGAGGNKLKVLGEVDLTLTIGSRVKIGPTTFAVIQNLSTPLIIGLPALTDKIIKIGPQKLEIDGAKIDLVEKGALKIYTVKSAKVNENWTLLELEAPSQPEPSESLREHITFRAPTSSGNLDVSIWLNNRSDLEAAKNFTVPLPLALEKIPRTILARTSYGIFNVGEVSEGNFK